MRDELEELIQLNGDGYVFLEVWKGNASTQG